MPPHSFSLSPAPPLLHAHEGASSATNTYSHSTRAPSRTRAHAHGRQASMVKGGRRIRTHSQAHTCMRARTHRRTHRRRPRDHARTHTHTHTHTSQIPSTRMHTPMHTRARIHTLSSLSPLHIYTEREGKGGKGEERRGVATNTHRLRRR